MSSQGITTIEDKTVRRTDMPGVAVTRERAEIATEIDSLRALALFGRWVLEMRLENLDCAIAYEDLQEKAVEFGLMDEVTASWFFFKKNSYVVWRWCIPCE